MSNNNYSERLGDIAAALAELPPDLRSVMLNIADYGGDMGVFIHVELPGCRASISGHGKDAQAAVAMLMAKPEMADPSAAFLRTYDEAVDAFARRAA